MKLGQRIRRRRDKLGLTQECVVAEVNAMRPEGARQLSQQNLGQLENRDSAKSEFVHELAVVLKTNVTWLLKGSGNEDAAEEPDATSSYARYIYENFDKLPPLRQQLVREVFSNWGGEPPPSEDEEQATRSEQHAQEEPQGS